MRRGAAAMTPPLSQPSSFAKGYGGQEGKTMKLKIDGKELGKQPWNAVKPVQANPVTVAPKLK